MSYLLVDIGEIFMDRLSRRCSLPFCRSSRSGALIASSTPARDPQIVAILTMSCVLLHRSPVCSRARCDRVDRGSYYGKLRTCCSRTACTASCVPLGVGILTLGVPIGI